MTQRSVRMVGTALALALLLAPGVAGCSTSAEPPVTRSAALRTVVQGGLPTSTGGARSSTAATASSASVRSTSPVSSPGPAPRTSAPARSTPSGSTSRPPRAAADPDVPGPDSGPRCPVDRRYFDESPTGLRADVLTAWISVQQRAASAGVRLCLNDGKRSAAQQLAVFNLYVKDYGAAAAQEYVLAPDRSAHVKGYAVDVQPARAQKWLLAGKGRFGWCRIYDNEPWHFEYSAGYRTSGCPARLAKPAP